MPFLVIIQINSLLLTNNFYLLDFSSKGNVLEAMNEKRIGKINYNANSCYYYVCCIMAYCAWHV